jgi:hypothetical protein
MSVKHKNEVSENKTRSQDKLGNEFYSVLSSILVHRNY